MEPTVDAVWRSSTHSMRKFAEPVIRLIEGIGVEGDAHAGPLVQHVARVKRDPTVPNLRQVHLIHAELHDGLHARGFTVQAGEMGENITTRGLDLLGLPTGTLLHVGDSAVVEVTGLRNPCAQLDGLEPGLMEANLDRNAEGGLVRKAGIMGIVLATGDVRPGDAIRVVLPAGPHRALEPV